MSKFEYLSVLISIIVGLGVSHLLSSAARMIQLRRTVRPHAPTFLWMIFLLLVQIQVWWVSFERSTRTEWQFFLFLLYLLIPVGAFLLSYLIVPDLQLGAQVDLRASFQENRRWLFGVLIGVVIVSLLDEALEDARIPRDLDALFRLGFLAVASLGFMLRSERAHLVMSAVILGGFVTYIVVLFMQLN